ncbi:MAG: hypothetical protein KFB93_00540 [Simkaniaceae bacterium]|nr:MAG: hypothetical protein KFB93_00540 [Simkaniaceae bacterium]
MSKKLLFYLFFILSLSAFAEQKEEITPPAGPFVKGGANVFITGEFLWWKGIQERLNYATTGVLVQPGTTISSGKVHKVHYPWKPGFRVGIGFYPGHDGWDLYARYTWYHSHSTDQVSQRDGNMVPVGSYFGNLTNIQVNGITSARSDWDLHYNVVDLELGRNFFLSKFLKTRLFTGLRGSWNSQDWNTFYRSNGVTFGGGDAALPGTISTKQDQDAWGIGIRMGFNLTWTFYKAWSLVSDASFTGIWVDYDNHRRDTISQTGMGSATIVNIKSNPNSTLLNIDLMLGFRGEWWIYDDSFHLSAQAGWENQIWLHYGNFIFMNGNGNGDLSFSGLTAKLRFDF